MLICLSMDPCKVLNQEWNWCYFI